MSLAPSTQIGRMPVGGGPESRILGDVLPGSLLVPADGIYFMGSDGLVSAFYFLSLATWDVQKVGSSTRTTAYGLSLSPDRKWLAYTQRDQAGSYITLVENLR